jgi:succinyl-diaminopimelate desuccinylase
VVGEPSSHARLGDMIKNGRRGSLNGYLKVRGLQGHVAYPQRAKNPLHAFAPVLQQLCTEEWDQGNAFFPSTSFQIVNLNMGTGAENVIPGELELQFNFRFSTELDAERIEQRVAAILDRGNFDYALKWRLSGNPFLTPPGELVEATQQAIEEVTGRPTELSTSGGTSDGRFIAPTGAQVIELGTVSTTIHQVNECIGAADLETLSEIYRRILTKLCLRPTRADS